MAYNVTLLKTSFLSGGVERVFLYLANGLANAGMQTAIMTCDVDHPYLKELNPKVRLLTIPDHSTGAIRQALQQHLQDNKPTHILTAHLEDNDAALTVRKESASNCEIIASIHWISTAQIAKRNFITRWWKLHTMRKKLIGSDQIIAVSNGVAQDIHQITKTPLADIPVIPNPVITPEISKLAAQPIEHPWLKDKQLPVILGVGRFTRGKDFATLIRAFAQLQYDTPSRLILLGEGRQQQRLIALVNKLGIGSSVDFPGFAKNPFNYMALADLFVLSSRFEGFGMVLAEALTLGTPVVSTDCPTGPREILQEGKFGPLVPVGDHVKMAAAMKLTLAAPLPKEQLVQSCENFTLEQSVTRYIETLGLNK